MPTKIIDVAAKATNKEINEIENNIKSSSLSSNGNTNEEQQQKISPLFRDEVQHQEMQYLDGLLMEENKKSSEEVDGKKKSEPSSALQQQQQSEVQYESKLASILKPYDFKDDDEKKKKLQHLDDNRSCSASHKGIPQSQNDNSNKYFRVGACSANSKSTAASNQQQKTIRNKVRGTLSNLIHRNSQTNKKNKQRQYSNNKKSQRKTATPSRNKRKSQMINFKGTQKRIITKMIKLGRKCTRHFTSIKHSIENVVVQAIHKTHSLLEQHQHNNSNGVVDLSHRTMSGTRRRYNSNNSSSRVGDGVVPPNNAFYFTPNGFGC